MMRSNRAGLWTAAPRTRLINGTRRHPATKDRREMTEQDRPSDTGLQAAGFSRVRQARQTETAEDYVEMIAELIDSQGEARIVELAERFGVAHATVNKTAARL